MSQFLWLGISQNQRQQAEPYSLAKLDDVFTVCILYSPHYRSSHNYILPIVVFNPFALLSYLGII